MEWIKCSERMPEEHEEEMSITIQHPEKRTRMVSDLVFVYDSVYGASTDWTINGKWYSEIHNGGYQGQIIHGIVAWMPIPPYDE